MNTKAAQERQQRILLDLVRQPGNDVCADCKGRAPRWASWNLGIFICVQCAGVHRKMGVHISKVKSLTLDTWTREQVDRMKEIGNIKSNRNYNPDEMRNRPPTNMEESERHSELEKYIRRKYEFCRFSEGRPPPVPTKDATFLTSPPPSTGRYGIPKSVVETNTSSRSSRNLVEGSSIARSRTAPIPSTWSEAQQQARANALPLPSPGASGFRAASESIFNNTASYATSSTPASSQSTLQMPSMAVPLRTSSALNTRNDGNAASASKPTNSAAQSSIFEDLISLSEPSQPPSNQPPLQMNPWATFQAQQQSVLSAPAVQEPTGNFWAGQSLTNAAGPPSVPSGVITSNHAGVFSQMRSMPPHANTLRTHTVQQAGMLSPGHGMMFPQYQQQRSASLGTMAFSTSPLQSPSLSPSNPFSMMQPQQLGRAAFQAQANTVFQPQQQQQFQQADNGMNQFQSNMMPNGYAQSAQYGAASMQQQQQYSQQGSHFGNMW
ncbi:related to AGE2 - ADP-ribosylation factor and GTPase activating protein effector [Melanopsichium pennsylvanicum]|uniref:Related to AGE2 - ADP-ribosylation factor and GTPase activating protein effector n=2 Tax=Melanopsichium pennsylvanicum TaxID=63383 RepID=A0AAJ4XS05_9BASI|nr:ap-domain-containing protein [Melanopsichium pennsylvanicum 4]SNX87243.1 related to AGE2 - ADP-ribosylation factor and GTPase activating protein effector [Melanopsichium pennsylvanicum]